MINDPVDALGNTFIFYSILSNDTGLTAFLCSKGANLKIKNRAGVCPNDLLQDNLMEYNKWSSLVNENDSLFYHCLKGEVEAVRTKLLESTDFGQEPWQPIVGAIYSGNEVIVRALIDNGIDVNHKICGRSLLMIAALLQRKNIVAMLLQRGAVIESNPEIWLRNGILELKKKSIKSNLWLGCRKDEAILDSTENANVDEILSMINSGRDNFIKSSSKKHNSLNSVLEAYFDLEIMINSTVGCCTKLDKIWISILQSTVKLAKAVLEKKKYQFAPLTLAIMNAHSELLQVVQYHLTVLITQIYVRNWKINRTQSCVKR